MQIYFPVAVALLLSAFGGPDVDAAADRAASAERFFRGVYACDPGAVADLAAEDVVISYPIFEKLFGTPAIRGREAVKEFAAGFCQRWADPHVTIHEAISEGDRVVLLWSFQARNVGSAQKDTPPTNQVHSWGGITLFRFDKDGKIVAEIGEETDGDE
jgi:ketosteroid isomerase-like protein